MSLRLAAALLVGASLLHPSPGHAGEPFADGSLLVQTGQEIREYAGSTLLRSIPVPYPVAGAPISETARHIAYAEDGRVHVYNGTFDPYLSSYDPVSDSWTHVTFAGWSTVNNLTYGDVAAFGPFVFVTDMTTFSEPADAAHGIIRYDTRDGSWIRFATDLEPIHLSLGHDGLLYALHPGGSPSGRSVDVYDPTSLAALARLDLTAALGWTSQRVISANDEGMLFVGELTNNLARLHPDASLDRLAAAPCTSDCYFVDLALSRSGALALGRRFGDVLETDEALVSFSSFSTGDAEVYVAWVDAPPPDADGDGVPDASDVCPNDFDPGQADHDGDGLGDACEPRFSATLLSLAAEDGYVRESSEGSGVGAQVKAGNKGGSALQAGDDSRDRQLKLVVSFDPASLPSTAKVVGAQLQLTAGSLQGTPETSLGNAIVELSVGGFGTSAQLEAQDFEAPATVADAGSLLLGGAVDQAVLTQLAADAISVGERIQLRVAYPLASDGDRSNDYRGWYSANESNAARHPRLEVEYID